MNVIIERSATGNIIMTDTVFETLRTTAAWYGIARGARFNFSLTELHNALKGVDPTITRQQVSGALSALKRYRMVVKGAGRGEWEF